MHPVYAELLSHRERRRHHRTTGLRTRWSVNIGGAHRVKKKSWGTLTKNWVPHDVRDQVVDFVRRWSEKTEIGVGRFPPWLGVTGSKFYDWRQRYGRVNEHNGWIPRDF